MDQIKKEIQNLSVNETVAALVTENEEMKIELRTLKKAADNWCERAIKSEHLLFVALKTINENEDTLRRSGMFDILKSCLKQRD
jgi:regulator of replication initiation timing